jgi:hypothetical protein
MKCITRLPYGITITRTRGHTRLSSELRLELVDIKRKFDAHSELATHALESLLLALCAAGIDLNNARAAFAVETAVNAVLEYLVALAS